MMKYLIDETSWNFDQLSMIDLNRSIEEILDVIVECNRMTRDVYSSSALYVCPIKLQYTICDLFNCSLEVHIEPEIRQRFSAIIARLKNIEDEPDWKVCDSIVEIDGVSIGAAPTLSYALSKSVETFENNFGCLAQAGRRPNSIGEVSQDTRKQNLYFISDEKGVNLYYRWLALEKTKDICDLEILSSKAFPDLDFVKDVLSGIKKMSKGYRDAKPFIISHLSVLNDHGAEIFRGDWRQAPQQFGSRGIDISDENGHTKQKPEAKKARMKIFDGTEYQFWWHTKIEPHTDRIYICQDKVASGGKIIIGVICDHLPT